MASGTPSYPRRALPMLLILGMGVAVMVLLAQTPSSRTTGPSPDASAVATPTTNSDAPASPVATPVVPAAALDVGAVTDVPFGSRPRSEAMYLRDCRDVVIENLTFRDLGPEVIAIHLDRCTNVQIRDVDFLNVSQAVYVEDSTAISVTDSRYHTITGPSERVPGRNSGNFVQFDSVDVGTIARNTGKAGDTEDIVSLFRTHAVVVEENHFEGVDWRSASGSGIALGDAGGSGNVARGNVLVNPGQAGIFIAGGVDHAILDNIVYGEQRPLSNVGIYVWNQSEGDCSGHTVAGNRVHWIKADGSRNPYWNAGNCGPVDGTNDTTPFDPAPYRVQLEPPAP